VTGGGERGEGGEGKDSYSISGDVHSTSRGVEKQEVVSSPYITSIQVRLGKMYVYLNKLTEARTILLNAGESGLRQFGYTHSMCAQTYYVLGLSSNAQGQYRDAMDCYIKARLIYCALHQSQGDRDALEKKSKQVSEGVHEYKGVQEYRIFVLDLGEAVSLGGWSVFGPWLIIMKHWPRSIIVSILHST